MTPVDAKTVLSLPLDGRVVSYNGGGDCFIVGGHFTLSKDNGSILTWDKRDLFKEGAIALEALNETTNGNAESVVANPAC